MGDIDRNHANWTKVQNWFFDKILSKEDEIFFDLRPLTKGEIPSGYLGHGEKIPQVDYQEALFDASRNMIRFKKPHRLVRIIGKIIKEKVGVTHSAILIYDSSRKSYILMDSRGDEGRKIPSGYVRLDLKSSIIEFFRKGKNKRFFENGIIGSRELSWILESGQLLTKDVYLHNKLRSVLKEMELLDAKVCVPCFFKEELLGVLILGRKASGRNFMRQEMNLFAILANDAAMALANAKLIHNLQKKVDEVEHLYEKEHQLFMSTALALAKAIDAHDVYTQGHTERVTKYCSAISNELRNIKKIEFDKNFDVLLYITALLHDIGKIGISERILQKKGKLTAAERKIVEKHPEIGASILLPIRELKEVAISVRSHQEWYNGNGYPDGLKRDEIPLIARIVSVADAFDTMTSDRPYRKKRCIKEVIAEIKYCSGTQFDPEIVGAFFEAHKKRRIENAMSK